MQFELSGARELRLRYRDAPALVHNTVARIMRRVVGRLQHYLVRQHLTGDPVGRRTGNLTRSTFSEVVLDASDIVGRVGFDRAKAVYARILEFGGIIVPVRAKHLTIPLGRALTPSGVARFTAREFISATSKGGAGIQGFTRSFVSRQGTAIMGVRKSGDFEPVFALVKRVRVPAFQPLTRTLVENRESIRREFKTGVSEATRQL